MVIRDVDVMCISSVRACVKSRLLNRKSRHHLQESAGAKTQTQ